MSFTLITDAPVPTIENALHSPELDVAVLTDPVTIQAYKEQVATQMNEQSKLGGGPRFEDLSNRIADIIIQTSAQGSSLLEVHLVDPYRLLLTLPDSKGNTFIQTDENGYLWPPIDVNFPPGSSDAVWRLVQCRVSKDLAAANLILTFEDRIASELRELAGPEMAGPEDTLGGFIRHLVEQANQRLSGHRAQALNLQGKHSTLSPVQVTGWTQIRLVEMIAKNDPNYTPPVHQPASTVKPQSPARHEANKPPKGLTEAQGLKIESYQDFLKDVLRGKFWVGPLTMQSIEEILGGKLSSRPPTPLPR